MTALTWLENWYCVPPLICFISSVPTVCPPVGSVHHAPKDAALLTTGAGPRYIGCPLAPSVYVRPLVGPFAVCV